MAFTGVPAWGPGSTCNYASSAAWGGPTLLGNESCTWNRSEAQKKSVGAALFNALDSNRDGVISRGEFDRLVQSPVKVEMSGGWDVRPVMPQSSVMPSAPSHEVRVEVMPEVKPNLTKDLSGAFVMEIPVINVGLSTVCTPPSPQHFSFKPHEVMPVVLPEVARVVFDPRTNMPRNGQMSCCTTKYGDIMEFDPSRNIEAKIKTNSPYGKTCLGSTVLNWRLHVEGHVTVKHGIGHIGRSRLEVDLKFSFDCNLSLTGGEAVYAEIPSSPVPWPSPQVPISAGLEWGISRPQSTPYDFHWTAIPGGPVHNSLEAFVEVMPNIQPQFEQASSGTFVMTIPDIRLRFTTTCNPAPPPIAGMPAFAPFEEIPISMPDISRVVFDPKMNMPRDGRISCMAKTSGTVMQFLPTYSMDAKLKTNSPHGTLTLRNVQDGSETVLNWKLQVEGKLAVVRDAGVAGSNQLDGELYLTFECYLCI